MNRIVRVLLRAALVGAFLRGLFALLLLKAADRRTGTAAVV
jgi:hypothetical protein